MDAEDRVTELLMTLRQVLEAAANVPSTTGRGLTKALSSHLGCDASSLSVLSEDVVPHHFADWDVALQHLADDDPESETLGVSGGRERYHHSLGDLLSTQHMSFTVGQVDYVQVPSGPDSQRQAVGFGFRLFVFHDHPVAVMQRKAEPMYGSENARFEVLCPDAAVAAKLLVEVSRLGTKLSLLRGQVITFAGNGFDPSTAGHTFLPRPVVPASDVVLPDGVLERVANHVLGVAKHAETLGRFGQHLKRAFCCMVHREQARPTPSATWWDALPTIPSCCCAA